MGNGTLCNDIVITLSTKTRPVHGAPTVERCDANNIFENIIMNDNF